METVRVYTTYNDMEAEMIRNLLADHSIECQVVSAISHSVFPFTHDHRLAKINVFVNGQEASRAEEIITDFLNSSPPLFNGDESFDTDGSDQEQT